MEKESDFCVTWEGLCVCAKVFEKMKIEKGRALAAQSGGKKAKRANDAFYFI